jgi:drug/metabolite transporter (DMT)-like permease
VKANAGRQAPDRRVIGIACVLGAVLAFSSSSSVVKWADAPGSVLAFWRLIGAVVLWWIVIGSRRLITGRPAPSAETWRRVLPAGLFFGLNITLFFTAIHHTSIAHAEFINALSPLLLVPAGAILFGELPNPRALAWGLVSIVGLAIVLGFGGNEGGASLGGDAIMMIVVCTWAGYLLTSRQARARVDVVDFMSTVMPIALLTAAPLALLLDGDKLWSLSANSWFAVALLSVLTGMLAHGLIVAAQRDVDIATIGILQVSQPAIAVVWGYLLLGEAIRWAQVPGMLLVLVGLAAFTFMMRPPKALERPACRTGSLPLNDATGTPGSGR